MAHSSSAPSRAVQSRAAVPERSAKATVRAAYKPRQPPYSMAAQNHSKTDQNRPDSGQAERRLSSAASIYALPCMGAACVAPQSSTHINAPQSHRSENTRRIGEVFLDSASAKNRAQAFMTGLAIGIWRRMRFIAALACPFRSVHVRIRDILAPLMR